MKALVGVDGSGRYVPALDGVLQLGFAGLELHLVNVLGAFMVDGRHPGEVASGVMAQIYEQMRQDGLDDLAEAEKRTIEAGVSAKTHQTAGDISGALLSYADSQACDLVAVASEEKDYWGSLFFGSVAKGLVTGAKQSVLVVKRPFAEGRKLRAVLATDHSDYANKCFESLVDLAPSGIESIHIVSAFGAAKQMAPKYQDLLKKAGEDERAVVKHQLETKNEELARKLKPAFGTVTSAVVEGRPSKVIADAVAETEADLVIMGAQGHGFLERLTMGSVSLHQVAGTPNNVLVLRV